MTEDDIGILEMVETSESEKKELEIKKREKVQIFPYQKEHVSKILHILENELAYLDVSSFGGGKTVIAIAIAIVLKMGIMVFGPKAVLPTWHRQAKKYGVHVYTVLTYNSLRGTEKSGVNHDLLIREGDKFKITPILEKCARRGLLIIFDECHYLKNENSQLEAAHTLVKEAYRLFRQNYNVRVAALSATPADKKENITSLFKILGIILSDKLYSYVRSSKTYIAEGLQEAINKCEKYDKDTTFHVTLRQLNHATSKTICHDLYTRVLKSHITSSMFDPPVESKKEIKNYFVLMDKEDLERMKKGALMFSSATSYKPDTSEISYKSINWGMVTESRKEIDSAKVNSIVRITKEHLEKFPTCKVILYFTFKRNMADAKKLLETYGATILNGDIVKDEDRTRIIENFQADNDNCRVLISNPKVGGVGIELDDKIGNRPRFMFIAPNYNFIDQFQATGRIHRKETKSKATIYFIYSREFPFETGILNSMIEKSRIARDMLQNNQNNIIFPGELDELIEKSKNELNTEIEI